MHILPSQRAHLYILEHSRIVQRDGRVEYISDEGREPKGFNIPVANTSFVLIGPGSSITNEAARMLKEEGVCIGFCGSGGTPLLSAQDPFPDMLLPADEYRDPGHLHRWISIWSDEARRLAGAKLLQARRLNEIERHWGAIDLDIVMPSPPPPRDLARWRTSFAKCRDTQELLGIEGNMTRALYARLASHFGQENFTRDPRSTEDMRDPNRLLDQGNYIAYGLASVVLWTLGIPASLSLVHGKTRRGGLVFDLADVIKDALIMPAAFALAARAQKGESLASSDFKSTCLSVLDNARALPTLFAAMNEVIEECSSAS